MSTSTSDPSASSYFAEGDYVRVYGTDEVVRVVRVTQGTLWLRPLTWRERWRLNRSKD